MVGIGSSGGGGSGGRWCIGGFGTGLFEAVDGFFSASLEGKGAGPQPSDRAPRSDGCAGRTGARWRPAVGESKFADIVLGYDHASDYDGPNATFYFGALVGRVANRIANAQFSIDGTIYKLDPNDGNNTLHGGLKGFSKQIWTVKEKVDGEFPHITLHYHSPDGDQGFPGALDVFVRYKIEGNYTYSVNMEAKPLNKATPVNLAQHSYWNLGGHNSGSILGHSVKLFSARTTPVDDSLIPTGAITPVCGTPFDLRHLTVLGSRIDKIAGGFDMNYVVDSAVNCMGVRKVANVVDRKSGRKLELWSNQPGVQFYTGNFLNGVKGKNGAVYEEHGGLCLETQGFPDSVNHPMFPYQIVNPGEVYQHYMFYKFSF